MLTVIQKKKKRIVCTFAWMICIICFMTGCANPLEKLNADHIVITTGFDKDDLFRIGKVVCAEEEFLLYLVNTQNRYESVYGNEMWGLALASGSIEERIKNTVASQLAQVKTLNLLAEENHIAISEEEAELVDKAADEYFASLSEYEKEKLHLTKDNIVEYYNEYLIAHKVYAHIIRDVNPEISDDEARTVTVEWIYVRSLEDDSITKQNMYNLLSRVRAGEDFEAVAIQNSDDSVFVHSFPKGEVSPEIERVAFNLSEGEISDVFFSVDGYYIMKCMSTLDQAETDANKIRIVERRKNEAFNEVYESFAKKQIKELNEEKWNRISLNQDENLKTASFFDIYEKYFADFVH